MTNDYIEHYKKNGISPVRQNIDDIEKHFFIRHKLYESLGIPSNYFKDKSVIEVGPGGGYNTIFTASLEPKLYQLVEANKVGVKEIEELLKSHDLYKNNIGISNCFIEEFKSNTKFDIAICEGMLPCVSNNYEILEKLNQLLCKKGILIITCSDEISIFFDMARRLLANILLKREKVNTFDDQIEILVKAFSSHLDTLKGFGRLKEDWCADNLMGNALYNTSLSVSDVIEFFNKEYSFYKMSPEIISDPTWFKEVPNNIKDFNQNKINNFEKTWHNLLHYKIFDNNIWNNHDIKTLRKECKNFISLCKKSEDSYTDSIKDETINVLKNMIQLLKINNSDSMIIDSIEELKDFLKKDDISTESVSNNFNSFNTAFGKGQQYISLIKE